MLILNLNCTCTLFSSKNTGLYLVFQPRPESNFQKIDFHLPLHSGKMLKNGDEVASLRLLVYIGYMQRYTDKKKILF